MVVDDDDDAGWICVSQPVTAERDRQQLNNHMTEVEELHYYSAEAKTDN